MDHPPIPISLLVALFAGAAPLDAQTIRGRVLDAGTDVGIPGAVVEALRDGVLGSHFVGAERHP